jgi:hypothetical protein
MQLRAHNLGGARASGVASRPTLPRRIVVVKAENENSEPKATSSLDDRIAAGEFTDVGSTKERLTRPIRRVLAQDPVGAGAR